MKVFKVYNATTDMWLDRSQRTFYALAVYGTAFSNREDAIEAARVTEACWAGNRLLVIEIDANTWSDAEDDERMADELYDLAKAEDLDTYGYQV